MKTVVKTIPIVVDVLNVSTDKYYGVKSIRNNPRGFITTQRNLHSNLVSKYDNKYIVLIIEDLTNGNAYSQSYYGDLITTIQSLMDRFRIYEFDTSTELFNWIKSSYVIPQ